MTARLPIGVIGVGTLGRHHARHLAAQADAELIGVYDIDPARTASVAAEVGCRAFSDPDALLCAVRAVTVAVPTRAHAEVGLRALEAGVPLLMEKPLAGSLEEADAMIAAAARRSVPLQVGHIERFNRALRAAAPYLNHPHYIESQRLAPFQQRGTDVPVVLDLMIHDLDLVLHLTGGAEVTEVRASGLTVMSPHLDVVDAEVQFEDGVAAAVTASRVACERVRLLRLFQADGYLSLDLGRGTGEFRRLRAGSQANGKHHPRDVVDRVPLLAPEADALALELQSFVHVVRGEREEVVSGAEGRAALALALRVTEAVLEAPAAVAPRG